MEQGSDNSLDDADLAIRKQSYSAMTPGIQVLDDLIHHINRGLGQLSGHENDRGLNLLTTILLHRVFNSLWRAREDAVLGYIGESLTLCRSALEHWITVCWIELHPEATDRWLWAVTMDIQQPTVWPPTIDAMLNELGEDKATPLKIYDMLSKFAHPKGNGLRWMIHYDSESIFFHAGGHFDERSLRVCLYYLIGTAHACLAPVAVLQSRMLGEPNPDWVAETSKLSDAAGSFMKHAGVEAMARDAKLPDSPESDLAD